MYGKGEKDLFGQLKPADEKTRKKIIFFLPRLKNKITLSYENAIFIAIGFVMCCIIFFSLGVEKGRQDVAHREEALHNQKAPSDIMESREQDNSLIEKKGEPSGYAIQLAAFKRRDSAEQELAKLRKQGYNAGVKKSGDFYQIYIGGFQKMREAEDLLDKLKYEYKDCYIKRL